MQTTDTIPSPALDLTRDEWDFVESWIDPMQSPPYVMLLLGSETGVCHIVDSAEKYKVIESCDTYEKAQLWLLEDEYEPVEGRFPLVGVGV